MTNDDAPDHARRIEANIPISVASCLVHVWQAELEVAQLRTENLGLRAENLGLRAEVDRLTRRLEQCEREAQARVVRARSESEPMEGKR